MQTCYEDEYDGADLGWEVLAQYPDVLQYHQYNPNSVTQKGDNKHGLGGCASFTLYHPQHQSLVPQEGMDQPQHKVVPHGRKQNVSLNICRCYICRIADRKADTPSRTVVPEAQLLPTIS